MFLSRWFDVTKYYSWHQFDIEVEILLKTSDNRVYISTVAEKWSFLITFLCNSHHSFILFLGDKECMYVLQWL